MSFDQERRYFLVRIDDCAKCLSDEEMDQIQGIINKVELLHSHQPGHIVISKEDMPKLFDTVTSLIRMFYMKKGMEFIEQGRKLHEKSEKLDEAINPSPIKKEESSHV